MARNGHSVPENVARTQYIWQPGRKLVTAYSLKCGSSTIMRGAGRTRAHIGQFEAAKYADQGMTVELYVRHPLDRLASAWRWFTQVQTSFIKAILEMCPQDHSVLMDRKTEFEPWVRAALNHYNPHWYPQAEYHTTPEGILVPNLIKDIRHLGATKFNETVQRCSWEDLYTEDLRKEMEDIYVNDVALYELAKEAGNDGFNTRIGNLLRQSRRDVWHDGLASAPRRR